MKILIADDHAVLRRGLKQIIIDEYPDAEVSEASCAHEIMTVFPEKEWDIIILDITMPGRNGIEITKDLKKINKNVRILIHSMYPEDQFAIRCFKAGASGYLTKESAPDELINAINTILRGRKYITQTTAEHLLDDLREKASEELHKILSNREYQVFMMIASGKTVTEIAEELSLSVKTISTNRSRILQKMKLKTNAALTHYAFTHKLVNSAGH